LDGFLLYYAHSNSKLVEICHQGEPVQNLAKVERGAEEKRVKITGLMCLKITGLMCLKITGLTCLSFQGYTASKLLGLRASKLLGLRASKFSG
jgi:hypothetical protein